jgi:hypothetical protein
LRPNDGPHSLLAIPSTATNASGRLAAPPPFPRPATVRLTPPSCFPVRNPSLYIARRFLGQVRPLPPLAVLREPHASRPPPASPWGTPARIHLAALSAKSGHLPPLADLQNPAARRRTPRTSAPGSDLDMWAEEGNGGDKCKVTLCTKELGVDLRTCEGPNCKTTTTCVPTYVASPFYW